MNIFHCYKGKKNLIKAFLNILLSEGSEYYLSIYYKEHKLIITTYL